MAEWLLSMRDVSKAFGSVRALTSMQFDLKAGEVHVLFGENGAGKSTLTNIIAGAVSRNSGEVLLFGEPVSFRDVHEARRRGVAAMFQEFSLAHTLTVEENLFLGAEPTVGPFLRLRERRRRAKQILDEFGFDIDPRKTIGELSRAQQQMVELTKAVLANPKVLILDEPTASFSERETEVLFDLVRRLKSEGVGIVYVTHRLAEIRAIGDRITVMRDGQFIGVVGADIGHTELVEMMTGRRIEHIYPDIDLNRGERALTVRGMSTRDGMVRNASLKLSRGEVVGIAGLVGCGKSEIGRAIFGIVGVDAGEIEVDGRRIHRPTPRRMIRNGVCYITSDRRGEGLMILRSVKENITLSALRRPILSRMKWIRKTSEKRLATDMGKVMAVKPFDLKRNAGAYSGGNQQKLLIARALASSARVFIFDEPTVGVDVGARSEIYGFIKQLVEQGSAVIIISSDLPDVMNLSHRLYVVRNGEIVDHIDKPDISERRILAGFFDVKKD